ncbi:MAG: NAD(P)H-binding protein [Anaerolineales bacterium]|nr:NAD(P)H-binding protein [Anaerolineales bacterium]
MSIQVLVLGGTGLLGEPVARKLQADGFTVRILVRETARAHERFPIGFEIVEGDVANPDNLRSALQGCDGVHISVGGQVDQLSAENVVSLSPGLGISRICYISGATVREENRWFPMVAQKLEAEKAIRECGIPYSIFCPTWPMEMVARFARDGKPFMMGKQPLPVHLFAAADLARMVSNAFQKQEAANKRFTIFGPEAITLKNALLQYCSVFHPEVEKVSSIPVWLAKLMGTLMRNPAMKFGVELMGHFEKTAERGDPAEANALLGAPQITLTTWMENRKGKGERLRYSQERFLAGFSVCFW